MVGRSSLRGRFLVSLVAVLLPVAVGCHAYRAVEGTPDAGRTLEVTLDTAQWRGVSRREVLTGSVVSAGGDSVRLSVPADQLNPAAGRGFGEDTVAVPYAAAERMRYRSISAWKSAAVAGGVVAATALTFEVAASGGILGGPGPGGGGAEETLRVRIPLLGW